MSKVDELRAWGRREAAENGLYDVKFVPGPDCEVPMERLAEAALRLLRGTPYDEDVTEETI